MKFRRVKKVFMKIWGYFMSLPSIVLNQVVVMFILMAVGFFCFKIKILNDSGKRQLTDLLLLVVNPLVVINAYQMPFDKKLASNLLIAFLLAAISHAIAIAIAYISIRSKKNSIRAPIERFAIIYTNCGFMALPLIQALFGIEGVFYASAYITVFNVLTWTHGYIIMSGKRDKKAILKAFSSPVVISVVVGIAMFFLKIKLPLVLGDSVAFLASLNTPIAMLVTGISLAQVNILSAFKSLRLYYAVFIMNLVVPLVAMCVYLFLPFDDNIILVNLVATACPCAVTTLLFATKFDRDVEYASKLLTLSNITCIITIPLVVFLYQTLSK